MTVEGEASESDFSFTRDVKLRYLHGGMTRVGCTYWTVHTRSLVIQCLIHTEYEWQAINVE